MKSWLIILIISVVVLGIFFKGSFFQESLTVSTEETADSQDFLEALGEVKSFPTPFSWWQFGALLHSFLNAQAYDEAAYGRFWAASKPLCLVMTLSHIRESRQILVGPSLKEVLKKVPQAFSGVQDQLDQGARLSVHAIDFVFPSQKSSLSRTIRLHDDEGLALESTLFTPEELLRSNCLSQSGEIRSEKLAQLFKFSDPLRASLLKNEPVIWTKIRFRRLDIDAQGVHLFDQRAYLTVDHLKTSYDQIKNWLQAYLDDFEVTLVWPDQPKPFRSLAPSVDLRRLQVALACSGLTQEAKSRLKLQVAQRQLGREGWIYSGQERRADLQIRATMMGLNQENIQEIDAWFDSSGIYQKPKGFSGQIDFADVLRYALFRKRFDWVEKILARATQLESNDFRVRQLIPYLVPYMDNQKISKWIQRYRSSLLITDPKILDNSRNLLDVLEALRSLPQRSFEENSRLVQGTILLLKRLVPFRFKAISSQWKYGLRVGRLASPISFVETIRALTHLDWFRAWLQESWGGALTKFEGRILDGQQILFYLEANAKRYAAGKSLPNHFQSMDLSGFILHRWVYDPLYATAQIPIYTSESIPGESNFYLVKDKKLLNQGMLLERVLDNLHLRVLTSVGEIRLGPGAQNFPETGSVGLSLDTDDSLKLIQSLYDLPHSQGRRLTLY